MNYAELVRLYFQQSEMLQWYWTLYVVVIGGLLAVAALRPRPDITAAILITVLYGCFAYKNLGAIGEATATRQAVLTSIKSPEYLNADTASDVFVRNVVPTLTSPDYSSIRRFHVFCDVMTFILVWALQWRRWRWTKAEVRKA